MPCSRHASYISGILTIILWLKKSQLQCSLSFKFCGGWHKNLGEGKHNDSILSGLDSYYTPVGNSYTPQNHPMENLTIATRTPAQWRGRYN